MKKTHSKHMNMDSVRRVTQNIRDRLSSRNNDAQAAVKRYLARAGVHGGVIQRTHVKGIHSKYSSAIPADNVSVVDPIHVAEAARLLEATCDMCENLSEEEMVVVSLKRKELVSFVCYMRQLDTEYRFLKDLIEANGTAELQRQAELGAIGSNVEKIKRAEFRKHGIDPDNPHGRKK